MFFLAVQQISDLLDVRLVRRRRGDRMHQPVDGVHRTVRLHAEVPLVPFLVWCISGSRWPSAFLVELGAAMIVASTMLPRLSSRPLRDRRALTA